MGLAEKYAYFKVIVPLLPMLVVTTILHSLGLLPTSSKWTLRTTLHVAIIRGMMSPERKPSPVSKVQATTLRDPGPTEDVWVAKTIVQSAPIEQDPVRDVVFMAIRNLGDGSERYTKPFSKDINAEWVGFKEQLRGSEDLPAGMTEYQRYKALMDEPSRTSNATILYFHGGAYYLCGFGTHRQIVSRLAKESAGRALAVEYRLAPQAAFPSQLIDALNAYLYLLYPPSDAFHDPVPAEHIVFAGDSAGGNLAFALLQLLLEMHRCKPSGLDSPIIRYNDREVGVPLPAGVSACSGWFDITRSMPSIVRNADFDYLPPPKSDGELSRLPHDHLWPAEPPRGDLFCDLSLLCHPLVSPIAANDWAGAPPLWISTGQEMLTDEDAFVAEAARQDGVHVQYEQHEWMPHCAMMLFPDLPNSNRGMKSWGGFIRSCADGLGVQSGGTMVQTSGRTVHLQGPFSNLARHHVQDLMNSAKERRSKVWERESQVLQSPALVSLLPQ